MAKTISVICTCAATALFFAGCGGGQWRYVRCEQDGSTTRIPRERSLSYQAYASQYDSENRSVLAATNTLNARIPDSLRLSIRKFRRYLPNERRAFQDQLQKLADQIGRDPCDSSARSGLRFLLENINFNTALLKKIAVACREERQDLGELLKQYRSDRD